LTQDLGRLFKVVKRLPLFIYDIKFKNEKKMSLDSSVFKYLGKVMDKSPRMGFWEQRPLREVMLRYASADADALIDLYQALDVLGLIDK
jgi:ribonuclease D